MPTPGDISELLEHSLDAVFLAHPDSTIYYASPAACALYGYTLEEFQALGANGVNDYTEPGLSAARELRQETGRFQGILNLRRKDGSQFKAEVATSAYTNTEGQQRLVAFVRDVTQREDREEALRRTNEELRRALAEVKQLQGLLPICSYCKRIRDDQNYWQQVEAYISARTTVQFSHGICPACYEKHVEPQLQRSKRDAR
ncbi:MAG: PAS domain S-box protein [SAR202 cluster bacterium]|nr:PAS domain S-box protein [SAR202 cluster bacterium]